MLEIRKTAVSFDERDLMELERVVNDGDEKETFRFVKKSIYDRILHAQRSKLKSHLDAANPVEGFKRSNILGNQKEGSCNILASHSLS